MRHDGGEAVGVPGDPVGQVAAERAAHRGRAAGVDLREALGGVGEREDVGVGLSAPAAPPAGDERAPVSGGQRGVGEQHRVAVRGHQPGVPPPVPAVPAAQRTTVDPQEQRRGGGGRRAVGQHEPGPQCGAVRGRGRDLGEGARQRGCRGRRGQGCRGSGHRAVGAEPDRGGRGVDGAAQRVHGAVRSDHRVGVGAVVVGEPGDGPGGEVDAVQRRAAGVVGGHDEGRGVGRPREVGDPAVPARRDVARFAAVDGDDDAAHVRRLEGRRAAGAQAGDPPAVGGDGDGPVDGVVGIVEEHAVGGGVRVGRDVQRDQRLPGRAVRFVDPPGREHRRPVRGDVERRLLERRARGRCEVGPDRVLVGRRAPRAAVAGPGRGRDPRTGPARPRAGSRSPWRSPGPPAAPRRRRRCRHRAASPRWRRRCPRRGRRPARRARRGACPPAGPPRRTRAGTTAPRAGRRPTSRARAARRGTAGRRPV